MVIVLLSAHTLLDSVNLLLVVGAGTMSSFFAILPFLRRAGRLGGPCEGPGFDFPPLRGRPSELGGLNPTVKGSDGRGSHCEPWEIISIQGAVLGALRATIHLLCSTTIFFVFFLSGLPGASAAGGCPHCRGNFASCTYDSDQRCPAVEVVQANAAVVAAGTGALALTGIIKPRFLRMFSRVAYETLLALIKQSMPGTSFTIAEGTTSTAILTAVSNGLLTLDMALFKLCDLVESTSDEKVRTVILRRMECIKTAASIKDKVSCSDTGGGLFDTGILTFVWAKVSEFVTQKGMQIKLAGTKAASESAGGLSAQIHRPHSMEQFSEMMNLYTMYIHGLAISSALILTDFFEHVVYDTIRYRQESWQLAHELMLIMFRRIEDSGGALNLGNVLDEAFLNTVILEASHNAKDFFRTHGGSPGAGYGGHTSITKDDTKKIKYNNKFTATGGTCRWFNTGAEHPPSALKPDGTCKFNHVCDHWVTNKGKKGRCLCEAGAPGHSRLQCDNPHRCNEAQSQ